MKRIMYLNGHFVEEDKAVVPITTHALHYGTGCFEGIRAYWNEDKKALFVFRLEDHFRRLENSCKILSITLPASPEKLAEITVKLIRKNKHNTDTYIRPLAYKADNAVGNFDLRRLKDGFFIYTVPMGRYHNVENGIRATITSWIRVSNKSIPPRGKITGAYANTSLAKTESGELGFDEALFLDSKGHVVEGSAENLFMVKGNRLVTPPTTDDILVGITRDTIMKLGGNVLKMDVKEQSILPEHLFDADEVFLVGTGAEVTPVVEIDGKKIGDGKVGGVTTKLKKMYADVVHGELTQYADWLTNV